MKHINQTTYTYETNPKTNRVERIPHFTFTFTTKEQYLEFVADWKHDYAKLSADIREGKKEMRETMRNRQYAGGTQNWLRSSAAEATDMIAMRKAAKVEAQKQYLAAKAASQKAA
jgi:hypothetical protein